MRNSCTTADDFLKCLAADLDDGCQVFRKRVHANINRRSEDEHGAKYSVLLQVSTVVQGPDFEYILEFGQKCGYDYEDASGELEGTANAEKIREQIREFAVQRGLQVMPGILDL